MRTSQNFHDVANIRVERHFEDLGAITLQIVGHKGDEVDFTLFGMPPHILSYLVRSLGDRRTYDDGALDEDPLEEAVFNAA